MFLRNAWYVAAWGDELRDQPIGRRICNEPIVLFRDRAGRAAALEDRCCHRGAPLSRGTVVERGLECGYHGLIINGAGRCVHVPGQSQIPDNARVRSYPVVEKNQMVWLWMGDAEKADPAKIIDFPYHDDPGNWPNRHDILPIKGNYLLMVDNLMDLTHAGYLHAKTIGGNPPEHVEAEMKTERTPTGVKFVRWMKNSHPPPTYVKAAGFKGRVDRWQDFEFVAPASVLQWTGAADAGSSAPLRDGAFQIRLFHSMTPETESSCFYFWSVANGYRQNESSATEQLYSEVAPTFLEDKAMVEGQQARLEELGEDTLVNIHSDTTRMQMRRTVQNMIADETGLAAARHLPAGGDWP